jgi:hypothetical protein
VPLYNKLELTSLEIHVHPSILPLPLNAMFQILNLILSHFETSFELVHYFDELHSLLCHSEHLQEHSLQIKNLVNLAVGKNTLGGMMAKISQVCNLSKRYTNHCIRSTCITALYDNGIETRHIMGLSGHKSESAVRAYNINFGRCQ